MLRRWPGHLARPSLVYTCMPIPASERGRIVYAVVKSGARQYRAEVGDTISVEHLPDQVGKQVVLKDVLLVADGETVKVGKPIVKKAKVVTTVVAQEKGPKVRIFRYHPRKRYRRRAGHRQQYTRLRVDEIVV
jgi:large subunit ribosomal protein L21